MSKHLSHNNLKQIYQLLLALWRYSPKRFLTNALLMLLKNFTSGLGLLLILPLLQHLNHEAGSQQPLLRDIDYWFKAFHIPKVLWGILLIYTAVLWGSALIQYIEQRVSSQLQRDYIHALRVKFYRLLLNTRWEFFLKQTSTTLLHTVTGQVQQLGFCNQQVMTLVNQAVMLVVYTVLACLVSLKMTLIAALCGSALLLTLLPLHRQTSLSGKQHLYTNRDFQQTVSEQLAALKQFKGTQKAQAFIEDCMQMSHRLENNQAHLARYTAFSKLAYTLGSVCVFSFLLYFAIAQLLIPFNTLLLLLVIYSRLLPMLSTLQQTYQRILHQLPAFVDLSAFMQACDEHQEEQTAYEGERLCFNKSIRFEQVSYAYPAQPHHLVLNAFSCKIEKNQITAIVGPSGTGKTTTIDLLVGLLSPTSGAIFIDEQRLSSKTRSAWRQQVLYMTQSLFLFNRSIRENLELYASDVSDDALWEALEKTGVAQMVRRSEAGLDTIVGDKGVRLSGGERQRLGLAGAFIANPSVLILDETTNSLDKKSIEEIQAALLALRGKMTIIMVTHQSQMSAIADRKISLGTENYASTISSCSNSEAKKLLVSDRLVSAETSKVSVK